MALTDEREIYTVNEITREIKSTLEAEFRSIWVEGEISNYLHHSSGHRYFTLKDAHAQIKAVIWRFQSRGLTFEPEDGMKVRLFGDITLYEKQGVYQIRVSKVEEVGAGSLQQQFEKLKSQLAEEGLFDSERKQPIPRYPRAIGIVTSSTGAAVRDIIEICRRRAPSVRLVLCPTAVQGKGAAESIVSAIEQFNSWGEVDLLIVGRGGGSLEDLWAFNEEIVARAIADSRLPIISAVGHEIDFTIADFAADLRAPTPSAAAELATFDSGGVVAFLQDSQSRLLRALTRQSGTLRERLIRAVNSRPFRKPETLLESSWQRLDQSYSTILDLIDEKVGERKHRLDLLSEKLTALSPLAVLGRGYSIVRRGEDGAIIKNGAILARGERVEITFSKGERDARIE